MATNNHKAVRLFIALTLPNDTQAHLHAQCREWDELRSRYRARFVREHHLTLKFLGDVPHAAVESMVVAMEDVFADGEPFDVSAGSLGAFSNASRASVLWHGIAAGAKEVAAHAQEVEDALEPLGFDRERRRFTPHITLARFRPPQNLRQWLASPTARVKSFPSFRATDYALVRSESRRDGAFYSSLATFPLT